LHFWHGHYDKGQAYFAEALAVNEASGSLRGLVWANRGLVGCALLSGDFATAAAKVEEITALLSRSTMPLLHAEGLAVIAAVHDMNGHYDLAAPYYDQLIQLNQKLGRFMVVAGHSLERAGMHLHLGQYAPAAQMVERARAIWENHARLGICYHYQGMIALAYEDYRGALAYLEQALAIHQGINSPGDEAGALALLALAYCGLADYAAAGRLLHQSRQLIWQTHGFIPLMENLLASARLSARQGQAEMALELYALAMRHPSVANSRLYDDIAGRYIRQGTTHLPPDTYQAAWQRGQARDLWQTAEALLTADVGHSPKAQQK
jgi:tetratricopeptide (TPR) repeat protein